jgi:hypothetical protein
VIGRVAVAGVVALTTAACILVGHTIVSAPPPRVDRSTFPHAFYCTVAKSSPALATCGRTVGGCRAHQAMLLDDGVLVDPCAGRSHASCFTLVRTLDNALFERCFPTPAICAAQRARALPWTIYRGLSECRAEPTPI